MMRTLIGLAGATLLLAGACLHQTPMRDPGLSVISDELEQYQSAIGMRVVLEHTADTSSAGATLVISAGTSDEDAARAGLAHLTEHLVLEAHLSACTWIRPPVAELPAWWNRSWRARRPCKVAGLGGNPYRDGSYAYYTSTEVVQNDPKGVGAFLLAAVESE
jgi:hypothetical protein